ncbi:MAG: hypothetical protein WD576_01315 [Nitriliruptoraceae bacterium]
MHAPRAQLRVFSPVDTFEGAERAHWERYVGAASGLTRRDYQGFERAAAAALLGGAGHVDDDVALVRRQQDRWFVCPVEIGLRAATGVIAFLETVPDQLAEVFVTPQRRRWAEQTIAVASRPPHVLDESWVVPFHWFLAFAPRDRRVRDHLEGDHVRVIYITQVQLSCRRLEHVSRVLDRAGHDTDDLARGAASLVQWLQAFADEAFVELDYGDVAELFEADELRADDTGARLWEIIQALDRGDTSAAATIYLDVRKQWSHRWIMQHAN